MLRAALAVTSRIVRRQRSVLFVNRSAQRRCVGTLRGGSTPITVADTVDGTEGIYPTRETDHTDDGDEGDNSGEHSVDPTPPISRLRPHRVVFSGGPCAGKTTAIVLLSDRLEAMGFRVLRVPEAATIMINSGISFARNPDDPCQSQVSLMQLQMVLEDAMVNNATNGAAVQGDRQSVVIIDRGCMDGKAYCGSEEEWQEVVRRATHDYDGPGTYTEEALRDQRYDQVFTCVKMPWWW